MQFYQAYDGITYPVRDGFNIYPEGWSQTEEDRALSVWRAEEPKKPTTPRHALSVAWANYSRAFEAWMSGGMLNERERLLLDAWTNRGNIDRALAWIKPYTYKDLGFETVCQVHGNRHSFDNSCGCVFNVVFDHHKREKLVTADIKPFRAEKLCKTHRRYNNIETQYFTACFDSHGSPTPNTWRPKKKIVSSGHQLETILKQYSRAV